MPLNTYECESCHARINYLIELDDEGTQHIECPRCGTVTEIDFDDLPERVRQVVDDLEGDNERFADDMSDCFDETDDDEDEMDRTIDSVENTFESAKSELSSLDNKLDIDTDIAAIADQYTTDVPVYQDASDGSHATERKTKKDKRRSKKPSVKERAKSWAKEKAGTYAKQKLADKWGADEQEIDAVVNIAQQLQSRAQEQGYSSIADLVQSQPELAMASIRMFSSGELAGELSDMLDDGSFKHLMKDAMSKDR